jgi:transcriptional regulator with XRE-family HTH domain
MGASATPAAGSARGARFRPGNAIAYWRDFRGLTQVQCADKMGEVDGKNAVYTVHAWRKWESGERTPDVRTWIKIARVLRVNVSDLLGAEAAGIDAPQPVPSGAVLFIRDALIGLPSHVQVTENEPQLLHADVNAAWQHWETGGDDRFDVVGEALPALITRAESAVRAFAGAPQLAIHATASSLYHLTWAYLRARGAFAWAMDAARAARHAAEDSKDAECIAEAEWGYAAMLSTTGNADASYRLLTKSMTRIEADLNDAGPGQWELIGQMNLLKAIQAVRLQRPAEAAVLLDAADRVAQHLGGSSNRHRTAFGAVNAEVHRVAAMLENSRYKLAVRLGEQIDVNGLATNERKVAFLVQLSHCYLRTDQSRAAVDALADAVDLSAVETSGLVLAHETVWGIKPAKAYAARLGHVRTALGLAS